MPWGSPSHKQCSVKVGDLCYGKTSSHLLAKLYRASFLSWKDKCLSAGVFPNDLAAGCEGREKGMIDMEFPSLFHLSAIEKCLNLNPSDLDGGSRGRGMGAALRGAECCDLSCFQLHVLLDLQQVRYGGVDAVGFCCGQPRDNDEHVGIKKPYLWFTAQQEWNPPKSLVITFRGTWGNTSFTCVAIFASLWSSVVKLWTMKPRRTGVTPAARQT